MAQHYVELNGELMPPAGKSGSGRDATGGYTLRMRFLPEENGESARIDPEHTFLRRAPIADLRDQPDPHHAALALMQAIYGKTARR